MNDEETPSVEEIKARLGDEIPVEEEPEAFKAETEQADIVTELRNLGRQFGDTLRSAWDSEERRRFESEIREGVDSFVSEVDKAFHEIRESEAAKKAKDEATKVKTEIDSGDIAQKAQSSIAQGLRLFSDELANLANQFTPAEKAPPEGQPPEDEPSE